MTKSGPLADLEVEIARVSKLASEAQHAASAAALLGGSTKRFITRRNALLEKLRTACAAVAEGDETALASALSALQAETA